MRLPLTSMAHGAPNGMVIVTTKRGVKSNNNISYSGFYGTQKVAKTLSVLNGPQWAQLFDDLYKGTPTIQAGLANNKKLIDSIGASGINGDWPATAIKTGAIQNHQLTVYGGDEKSRYSLSGNYFNQDGIVTATNFKRYSGRFNFEKIIQKTLSWPRAFLAAVLLKIFIYQIKKGCRYGRPFAMFSGPDGKYGTKTRRPLTLLIFT